MLGVVEPHMTGVGGDLFAVVWMAGERMIVDEGVAIDIHLPMVDATVPYSGPQWLPSAVLGWYLGRLELSPEMMEAFFAQLTEIEDPAAFVAAAKRMPAPPAP